jgi:rubrerythrin
MLSFSPLELSKLKKEEIDKEILRLAIVAELDAVSLYEQMAQTTDSKEMKKVLLDIAKEEKTHVGEFQALLLKADHEQKQGLREGEKEIGEILNSR